ncbi:MAG: acyltransferase [Lawsonibacter sp.]|nr:acyltransferase [Lawsonibacter sp.]
MSYNVLSKYRTELMGAAILWVMLFHAFDLDLGFYLLNWGRAAGFGGVDVFILLSSMGLTMSLSRREQDYSAFMARRAGRILPAYYLVMLPYTLFGILYRGNPWSSLVWNSSLLYYWLRSAGAFNWYVAGSMTFYALTPACFRAMRDSRNRELLAAAGVLLGLSLGRLFMWEEYWYVMDLVFRIPIFFLGILMGFYILEDRRLGQRDILFWSVWFVLGGVYLLVRRLPGMSHYMLLARLFLFTTIPMCLAACWCFERLPLDWLRKPLRLLGAHSLEIYLLNVSLFSEVELLRRFVSFGPSNRMYYLLSFTVNIALGLLLHRLVERLRALYRKTPRGTA